MLHRQKSPGGNSQPKEGSANKKQLIGLESRGSDEREAEDLRNVTEGEPRGSAVTGKSAGAWYF